MTLLICSKSTQKYLPQYGREMLVTAPPQQDILKFKDSEEDVVAIGGGAVIDTAKIVSRNPITCYPTTAAGSTATAWSVYWEDGKKKSLLCQIPKQILFDPKFIDDIPKHVLVNTCCDVISHCLDSLNSRKTNASSEAACEEALDLLGNGDKLSLLKAGHRAGEAIQITGTNLLHSLSYPMTSKYGIPHGRALACLLPKLIPLMVSTIPSRCAEMADSLIDRYQAKLSDYDIDIDYVVDEAYTYSKINECAIPFTPEILKELLRKK